MENYEIEEIVERIEQNGLSDESTIIKYMQHGGGPDESHILANRAGYLRLAVLFLCASIAPYKDENLSVIDLNSSDIIDEDSDVSISWLERREDIANIQRKSTFSDKITSISHAVYLLIVLILLIIGIGTVASWIF